MPSKSIYQHIIHPNTQESINIHSKGGKNLIHHYTKIIEEELPLINKGKSFHGWGKVKPTTKTERIQLLNKCGSNCFLLPNVKPHPKFPICPKNKCAIDCKGVTSAYIRARQWKYDDVANKAKILQKKCKS